MTDLNQANKALVRELWAALDGPAELIPLDALAAEVDFFGHEPVGSISGALAFMKDFWLPLRGSFTDFRRETHLFFGGESNGQADGNIANDGHHWVTGTGLFHGTFSKDYLGIPATGETVSIRWGDFTRVEDGKVVEIYFMIDMIDLMRQAGFFPLPPSTGADGIYPGPAASDGKLTGPQDPDETTESLRHIREFIFDGLNAYDEDNLTSMGMADYFHPDVKWYGPGGIGACLNFTEFEDLHQAPWLVAFPDRQVQNLTALFAEGSYSGGPGWAGVSATHSGPYLGVAPTGAPLAINGLDWWRRDGNQYIENWVFVDMIHLFAQMGVDLLEQCRESG